MEHKFYAQQGILQCYAYSVKNSEIEKQLKQKEEQEKLGIAFDVEDEKIYGEPMQMVLDFNSNGGISFFTPNKAEIYEEGNFTDATHVEFEGDLDFVLLVSFEEFKKIYYEYKGIVDGN